MGLVDDLVVAAQVGVGFRIAGVHEKRSSTQGRQLFGRSGYDDVLFLDLLDDRRRELLIPSAEDEALAADRR